MRDLWFNEGLDVPVNLFAEAPTIHIMAAKFFGGSAWRPQAIVQLRPGDTNTPLLLFAGGTGLPMDYTDFVRHLDYPGPIYGPLAGMDRRSAYSKSVSEEAERAVATIRSIQPHGSYRLMGYSSGGCHTLEAARALRAAGEEIGLSGAARHRALGSSGCATWESRGNRFAAETQGCIEFNNRIFTISCDSENSVLQLEDLPSRSTPLT